MKENRIVLTPMQGKPLPVYIETIGLNPNQEKIVRPNGYPHFHWLQTINGKGRFSINNQSYILHQHSGMLIRPNISHSYQSVSGKWETAYVTFNGKIIGDMLAHAGIKLDAFYQWESESPLTNDIITFINQTEKTTDVFGLQASTYMYHFLLTLNNYARSQKPIASEHLEKIHALIQWMHGNISNPNVGLNDFAAYLHLSPRNLNNLFRETFSMSPYAYFIDLRLRTAKQLLVESKNQTIKAVAKHVGFRSPSHFVATFRKHVGMPPEQFRKLH
ncbi:AraC family transcriptional regulator [Aquibacillus albus]|uniref:AraC-like DNA-binding protein n=1 Tax=Aquibacillus albus TaxID=1168171 RepID=A0ABS2MWT1_9BACI|nr:AraC family transcriptional regulator [Aquibacillus albus]MBM7570354.1 AraC-like DNA-binding protein [Aquibacillus albus]